MELRICRYSGSQHFQGGLFASPLRTRVRINREKRLELREYFARRYLDLAAVSTDPLNDVLGTQSRQIPSDFSVHHIRDGDGQPGHCETLKCLRSG